MVEANGARSLVATRAPRAEQHTARPMVVAVGAIISDAPRVQRVRLTCALLMVVGGAAVTTLDAPRQHVAGLDSAFGMEVGSGAPLRVALGVLRDRLVYASPMVAAGGASL